MGTPWQETLRTAFRIVWAITAKDLVDALRSKTIAVNLVIVFVMMLVYKTMPAWDRPTALPRLYVYEAGGPSLTMALEGSSQLEPRQVSSQEKLVDVMSRSDEYALGLMVPADVDAGAASSALLELEGYVVYWASEAAAGRLRSLAEEEIADRTGHSVRIHLEGNRLHPAPDAAHPGGAPLMALIAMLLGMLVIGLSVAPHLLIEERQTRTLDLLLVSPARSSHIVLAKALTSLFYCLTAGAVILAFNTTFINHWDVAILVTGMAAIFAAALGLLLGTICGLRPQVVIWTMTLYAILLIPVFLSFTSDILPGAVKAVVPYVPTVALARGFQVTFAKQATASAILPELAYAAGWAALLLVAVAWVVRRSDR
jgi:ABC-2 type transport system permease protein